MDTISIVRGNDFRLRIPIVRHALLPDGRVEPQEFVIDDAEVMKVFLETCDSHAVELHWVKDDEHDGSVIADVDGLIPCGTYHLIVAGKQGGKRFMSRERRQLRIVESNERANIWPSQYDGFTAYDLDTMIILDCRGRDGLSAYELAVLNGFTGTETQWLHSLAIKRIEKTGTDDLTDTYTITYSNGTTSTFEIENGESAYHMAVRLGVFTGTEEEWCSKSNWPTLDEAVAHEVRDMENALANATATVADADTGTPGVNVAMEDGALKFTFDHIKGEKGDTGATGPKGDQGDSAIFDPETGNIATIKQALGSSTESPMSQKAVTEAIAGNMASAWENVTGETLTGIDMDSSGNVTAFTGHHKIFYAPVHEGKPIEVTFTKAASELMQVVIALFDVAPAAGGSARQDGVLFAETVTAGTHTYRYPVNGGSYIALGTYGAATTVTFKEGMTATDMMAAVEERMNDVEEEVNGDRVDVSGIMSDLKTGHFVSYLGKYSGQSSYGTTPLFSVQKGDMLTVTSSDNYSGNPAIIAKYLSTEPFDYSTNHNGVFACLLRGEGAEGGLKTRTYMMTESCTVMISYLLSGGLELSISRGGVAVEIDVLKSQVEDINPIDHTDGTTIGSDNPLAHIISGPSRVRTFASYGVIGGSFETGYTNAKDGSSSATPYDIGYEWPTLLAKTNGVVCYNYALPGHSWKTWLEDRNKTTYSSGNKAPLWKNAELPWASHRMPWNNPEFTEKPECFILNLSSNDASASYTIGDASDIDFTNDYTDDEEFSDRSFVEAAAAILQLIRIKSPRCYIFVANMRAGRSESRVGTLNDAVDTIVQKFNEYAGHCYLLDITSYGFDWNTNGANKYVSGDASSHPTRLGHVYLADQFNTYIDWYIANHPEEFLDAAYVGPMQYQYTDPVTHERKWAEKYYTRQSS